MLECSNIEKHYGGVYALKGVRFELRPGEVHALCGENGAGKSTLSKILAGVVQPDGGAITLDGRPVRISHPTEARRLGIGIVFQELDLFNHLTVAENIVLGHPEADRFRIDRRKQDAFCAPFLQRVGLPVSPRLPLRELGIAQAQLVAIARALAMRARILLLDEPTSSLTEDAAARLLGLVLELKAAGTGIVYVSHKMKEIFQIADCVTVLRDGSHVSTLPAAATSVEETIHLMVGRDIDISARAAALPGETVALRVQGLRTRRLAEVNFEVRRGEVLGIAGLVGSGRSALGEALFGLDAWEAGTASCLGRPYRPLDPRAAIAARFAYLPRIAAARGFFSRPAFAAMLPPPSCPD